MKRVIILLTVLLLFGAITTKAHTTATNSECRQWVEKTLKSLTTDQKIGQLVVVSLPAHATAKKQVRDWVKSYAIGGLMFNSGTAEAQALLTNLAQKAAAVPLLTCFDAKTNRSLPLASMPAFPANSALECVTEQTLLTALDEELKREYSLLAVSPTTEALLRENGMEVAEGRPEGTIALLKADMQSGKLTADELDERCRKALTYKYQSGVRPTPAPLPTKGITAAIHTTEAQTLATNLHNRAITVLCNHFGLLPLTDDGERIAILSMGSSNADADIHFVHAMQALSKVGHYKLAWNADEATRQNIITQLKPYRRVIVTMAETAYISAANARFLAEMPVEGAETFVFFTPYHPLLSLTAALRNASAVVLAHDANPELQKQVAQVLFAKNTANGKLAKNIAPLFPAGSGCAIEPGMKHGELIPEDYGMRSSALRSIDAIAQEGVDEGAYPGCRILVWKEGKPVYDKCFGTHSDTDKTPVRPTDLFDLSNMTKSTATLLAIMKLYDQGKLNLSDRISQHIPTLRNTNKADITIRQLLLHESGLPPYIRFYMDLIDPNSVHGPYSQSWEDQWHHTQVSEHGFYCSDFKFRRGLTATAQSATHPLQMADGLWLTKNFPGTIMQKIAAEELSPKTFVYSDLGFVLLQKVVENISGMPLNTYLDQNFYGPMGLTRTHYLPLTHHSKEEIMPTAKKDFLRRQDLCGYVHDEVAACLGGVSGNAGLFSTAEEVAKIYQMLLNGGEWEGQRYLSESTCKFFLTEKSAQSHRGLGFDKPNPKNLRRSPCTANAPIEVFGHTGTAGTCVWADPINGLVYVFLSNRLCPNAWNTKLSGLDIERRIQEVIYNSIK